MNEIASFSLDRIGNDISTENLNLLFEQLNFLHFVNPCKFSQQQRFSFLLKMISFSRLEKV